MTKHPYRDGLRNGQLIDGEAASPYQSCSLCYEARLGPVLSIPYVEGDEQFSHTEGWFQECPPASLIFEDNLGTATLTGLKVRARIGSPYVLGTLRANVVIFGRPRQLKPEYKFTRLSSRFDGLDGFAGFSSIITQVEPGERGHRVTAVVESKDRVEFRHGDFSYAVQAKSPWRSTLGRSFEAETETVVETISAGGATADDHLSAQRPIRALLITAYGQKLYWRSHQIQDDQFPVWTIDGASHAPEPCSVLLKATIEDFEQPEPRHADIAFPMFFLRDLKERGLRKWLDLYQDPIFRRAIEPVVEVINGASRFLEPQILMTVLALDAMGHYRDASRVRHVPLHKQIDRCALASGLDFHPIGPADGIAKAIANMNNDLKHPDRHRRPDPLHMSLIAQLGIAIMRMQLFELLGLSNDDRVRALSNGDISNSIRNFTLAQTTIDGTGRIMSA